MQKSKVPMMIVLTVLCILAIGVADVGLTQVKCNTVDRVGNKHNCTGWTGWYEF